MDDENKASEPSAVALEYLSPKEPVTTVYSNNTGISISNWDVSLVFGVVEDVMDEKLPVRKVARVIVSLQHAKAVSRILAQQLARFEEQYGEIREFGPSS